MTRKIIAIDKDKCNGCGKCAFACHEGAIEMIDGVATLTKENYCDGLGDCLPVCPTNAISFEIREAPAYDEKAVELSKAKKAHAGCIGSMSKTFKRDAQYHKVQKSQSQLLQWPCQIKLVPVNATYFDGANLLIAADCTAFSYGSFHEDFMKNHITLIGCPKLDSIDYAEKLTEIIKSNNIISIKVVRMEVPCCSGIENAVKKALVNSGKLIPWQVITITTDGQLSDR